MSRVDMNFGLTESYPKAMTVGPLFSRKNTGVAKKRRAEMVKDKQARIQERIQEARVKKEYDRFLATGKVRSKKSKNK